MQQVKVCRKSSHFSANNLQMTRYWVQTGSCRCILLLASFDCCITVVQGICNSKLCFFRLCPHWNLHRNSNEDIHIRYVANLQQKRSKKHHHQTSTNARPGNYFSYSQSDLNIPDKCCTICNHSKKPRPAMSPVNLEKVQSRNEHTEWDMILEFSAQKSVTSCAYVLL